MSFFQRKRNGLLAAAVLSVAAGAAHAHGPDDAGREPKRPQATLEAQASRVVEQDTVTITLAAEVSDPSQSKVTAALAKTLESVTREAKAESKVKTRSGNYRVWPFNDEKGKITNWRGRAEVILESSDFALASELASRLSERMPIAGMNFSVSPQARAKYEQELLAEAAKAFRDRAQALADAFGFASYSIRNIDLGGGGAQYQPMPRVMAMSASAEKARVPVEPGTETVTLSVRGSIFLSSRSK